MSDRFVSTTGWSVLCAMIALGLAGCTFFGSRKLADRIQPSNDLNWSPEQAVMPYAEVDGTHYVLRNLRNCDYVTTKDFVVNHYDRAIDLSQIQTVDYIVAPFSTGSLLAHTMASFGLDDGSYICLSIEVRRHVGDSYRGIAGLTRGYDLIYVMGEERDLIGSRTDHFDVEVYVYPSTADPRAAQAFFVDVVQRMNKLRDDPEFYHLLANNCTTNLKDHVNEIQPQTIRHKTWEIILPGLSASYAHKLGLIENRIPFEDLQTLCYVNDLAKDNLNHPNFSQQIRSRRYMIDRAIARNNQRDPSASSRGAEYLTTELPNPFRSFSGRN